MKLEVKFDGFEALIWNMGAKYKKWKSSVAEITPFEKLELFSKAGKEVNIDQVVTDDDGLIRYKGEIVLLYIRDIQTDQYTAKNRPEKTRRFHFAYRCETLRYMRQKGKYNRYIVSKNTSGKFLVDAYINKENHHEYVEVEAGLMACKNCIAEIQYKGIVSPYKVPDNIWRGFIIEEFFKTYKAKIINKPKYTEHLSPKPGYPKDWNYLSRIYRENRNYVCEGCGVKLSQMAYKKLLHTHHRDGIKSNSSPSNLEALCISCHAKEGGHLIRPQHMKEQLELCKKIQYEQNIQI